MNDLAMRIAAALRDGRPPAEMSGRLDELEDSLLRAGYTAGIGPFRSVAPDLPGIDGGHPQLEVFACPSQVCSRVVPPDDDVPICRVLDRPLRRVRLGR
ncbi:hypothetical protein [Saccharopolyspora cebuensis]|uniref:hypothetical protein n=1 Tax=Saccharopolyspora cebuensis TaxID=418759 RepID=UPI0031E63177